MTFLESQKPVSVVSTDTSKVAIYLTQCLLGTREQEIVLFSYLKLMNWGKSNDLGRRKTMKDEGKELDGTPLTFDEILADKKYQAEFDRRLSKGIETAKTNWQEAKEPEVDKLTELETSNNTLSSENSYLKAQIEIASSDVKKEFTKFVTSEVLSMVNDTTDLKAALNTFKKTNPQYFGEVIVKKVQSSPTLNGGGSQPQTTNSIMNDLLRNARNNN